MPRPRRAPPPRLEALAALVLALGAAPPAAAFELQRTAGGQPLRWDGLPSPRYVVSDELGPELARAARWAHDTWGRHLRPPLSPSYAGRSAALAPARDGSSLVSAAARWPYGDARRLVAYTELHYDSATGRLLEADLTLNREGFRFAADEPGAMDPESVLLHEVGHALGLAHSCGDPGSATPSCFSLTEPERTPILDAVMAPNLGLGEQKRALGADDRAGLRALYAEGFVPSATVSLGSVERRCEDEAWVVYGLDLPSSAEVQLRLDDGRVVAMEVLEESGTSLVLAGPEVETSTLGLDLVVSDAATGARAVLYDAAPAAPSCDPAPAPPAPPLDTGCDCATSAPAGPLDRPWLLLAALARLGWRWRRRAGPLLVLGLLALGARPAQAYRCSRVDFDQGPSLYWQERVVDFYIHDRLVADEAQNVLYRQEIITSLGTWTQVDCSDFELRVAGVKEVRPAFNQDGPNENVITFVGAATRWPYSPGIIAVTTNTFETSTGRILDSDIEVNAQHFELVVVDEASESCDPETGAMDLQNTMTHEVGHVVGLDHPPSTRAYADTTMFASAPSCETKKRSLAEDDIAGLCDIYPAGQPVAQCFPPNGPTFVVVETDDGFGGCTALAPFGENRALAPLGFVLALVYLRSRRARRSK